MKNVAVILAAGTGKRLGAEVPKQFLMLAGKPVLAHSLQTFLRHEAIHEICVVGNAEFMDETREVVKQYGGEKVKKVIAGGKERSDSSLAAIRAYEGEAEDTNLLLHDAARPLLSEAVIDRLIAALKDHKAVCTAIASADTILETEGGSISAVPQRERLRQAQTPQAFRLSVIAEAYRRAASDKDFRATDDCGVVMRYLTEEKIHLVEGEARNRKLTTPADIPVLELMAKEGQQVPIKTPPPTDFLADYRQRTLRPLQLKMLEMLRLVGDILTRGGVRWWLQGGTLLGAVRHGGFIPWDDDVDIDVLKEDVPLMLELLRRELPPEYELPEPPRRTPIYKVRLKDSFFVEYADDFSLPYNKGIYIDIFPQGPAPSVSRRFARTVARGYCKANSILGRQHYYSLRSFAEFFWFGARRALFRLLWSSAKLLLPSDRYLAQDLQNNGLGLLHEKDKIFPLSTVRFEGIAFPAPADTDFYLREDFGDYMQLPPENQRHGHAVYWNLSLSQSGR